MRDDTHDIRIEDTSTLRERRLRRDNVHQVIEVPSLYVWG